MDFKKVRTGRERWVVTFIDLDFLDRRLNRLSGRVEGKALGRTLRVIGTLGVAALGRMQA